MDSFISKVLFRQDTMGWYERHHKTLFIAPIILLLLAVGVIIYTTVETGSFVRKGVSLSGGVSATVTLTDDLSAADLRTALQDLYPQANFEVRTLSAFGGGNTFVVDASEIHPDEQVAADMLSAGLREQYMVTDLSVETTGPSLGQAFFMQTIIGILLAFLWMGWVVYLYFGDRLTLKVIMALIAFAGTVLAVKGILADTTGVAVLGVIVILSMVVYFFFSVPSGAVILAAASTILFTLAVINLLGLRLSTAGVAAFLMLIGYSVDTDILLSTRVLKNKDKSLEERIRSALSTGITMQLTTIAAVVVALLVTNSEIIRQIMLIILIGMVGDIIFTWLQNAGILYWFVSRQERSKITHTPTPRAERIPRRRRRR